MSVAAIAQDVSKVAPAEQIDLRREFNEVGIGEVLDQLEAATESFPELCVQRIEVW